MRKIMDDSDRQTRDGLPTGGGTAPAKTDVADPHPSNEDHFDRQNKPGGANPPRNDIGPNSGKHDGTAKPKPDYGNHQKGD